MQMYKKEQKPSRVKAEGSIGQSQKLILCHSSHSSDSFAELELHFPSTFRGGSALTSLTTESAQIIKQLELLEVDKAPGRVELCPQCRRGRRGLHMLGGKKAFGNSSADCLPRAGMAKRHTRGTGFSRMPLEATEREGLENLRERLLGFM